MSLASLNSSGIQQSNPALYQTLKDLYDDSLQLQNLLDSYGLTYLSDLKQLNFNNSPNLLKGQIQFPNTQNPSSNVNTLDDYEEGTWVPVDNSGAGLVLVINSASYIKIGKAVFLSFSITYPVTASAVVTNIGGLPYTIGLFNSTSGCIANTPVHPIAVFASSATVAQFYNLTGGTVAINSDMSGGAVIGTLMYTAAN